MANGGNRSVETCQQTRRRRFIRKDSGVTLEAKGGHAAANVVPHRVGIDESLRRDYCAGADLLGKVHVRHHCHVTDIVRLGQPGKSRRHVTWQRTHMPAPDDGLGARRVHVVTSRPKMRNINSGTRLRWIAAATSVRSLPVARRRRSSNCAASWVAADADELTVTSTRVESGAGS